MLKKSKERKENIAKLRSADGCDIDHWYAVKEQSDIDFLMEKFGGFHDSALIRAEYKNGRFLKNKSITSDCDELLSLFFKSQWIDYEIELKFTTVRRFGIEGRQDKYFDSSIMDCTLSFLDKRIVFANFEGFNPSESINLNDEKPIPTFVIAESLSWRFIEL